MEFDTGAGAGAGVDLKGRTGFASRAFPDSLAGPIPEVPLERLRDPKAPSAALVTVEPKDGALAVSPADVAPKLNGAGATGVVLLSGGRLMLG